MTPSRELKDLDVMKTSRLEDMNDSGFHDLKALNALNSSGL